MLKPEESRKLANEIYQAVRKLLNSKNVNPKLPEQEMEGVVIFWFPKNHEETTEVATTAQGKICKTHLVAALAELCNIPIIRMDNVAA